MPSTLTPTWHAHYRFRRRPWAPRPESLLIIHNTIISGYLETLLYKLSVNLRHQPSVEHTSVEYRQYRLDLLHQPILLLLQFRVVIASLLEQWFDVPQFTEVKIPLALQPYYCLFQGIELLFQCRGRSIPRPLIPPQCFIRRHRAAVDSLFLTTLHYALSPQTY